MEKQKDEVYDTGVKGERDVFKQETKDNYICNDTCCLCYWRRGILQTTFCTKGKKPAV